MRRTPFAVVVAVAAIGCRPHAEPAPQISVTNSYWNPPEPKPTLAQLPQNPDVHATGGQGAMPSADGTANSTSNSGTAAIIADHRAAADFSSIPTCWLKRGARVRVAYGHTSHGEQIVQGLNYLAREHGAAYAVGEPRGLALRDGEISRYGASDLGFKEWPVATRGYLKVRGDTDAVMWSWCGQVGEHTRDMVQYLFEPVKTLEDETKVRFIYMTGHLTGDGPGGATWRANDLIRNHVRTTNGVLFDFADIETISPDGKSYASGSDDCQWCSQWCANHPADCRNLPECSHSHGFNCIRKGKAYWWLVARLAGWSGRAEQACQ